MTKRYGAENERSAWMRFHTQTAGVSLTPQQPLNNLTRVALQALAGVLGGTQSLHTDAYDEALAVPTAEAALLALRQQQIIAEESGVDATVDPLGGSWFVEALTDETERAGVALHRRDRRGGAGWSRRSRRASRSARSPTPRTATSASSMPASGGSSASTPTSTRTRRRGCRSWRCRPGRSKRHLARLERTRRERDAAAVEAALGGLRDAAARPGSSETNLMPHFIRCAEAYATLGEQCAVLRGVFGEYREPVAV